MSADPVDTLAQSSLAKCPDGIDPQIFADLTSPVDKSNTRSYELGSTRPPDTSTPVPDRPRYRFTGQEIVDVTVRPEQLDLWNRLQAKDRPTTLEIPASAFMMRHGQAGNNTAVSGVSTRDAMLTEHGKSQSTEVEVIIDLLSKAGLIDIVAVMTSTLKRTRETTLLALKSLLRYASDGSIESSLVPFIANPNLREILSPRFNTVRKAPDEGGKTDPTIEDVFAVLGGGRMTDEWAGATKAEVEDTFEEMNGLVPAVRERILDMLEDVVRTTQILHELREGAEPSGAPNEPRSIDIALVTHWDFAYWNFLRRFMTRDPWTWGDFQNADMQLIRLTSETRGRVTDADWSATVHLHSAKKIFGPKRD